MGRRTGPHTCPARSTQFRQKLNSIGCRAFAWLQAAGMPVYPVLREGNGLELLVVHRLCSEVWGLAPYQRQLHSTTRPSIQVLHMCTHGASAILILLYINKANGSPTSPKWIPRPMSQHRDWLPRSPCTQRGTHGSAAGAVPAMREQQSAGLGPAGKASGLPAPWRWA